MTPAKRVIARFHLANALVDPKKGVDDVGDRLKVFEEKEADALEVQASGYTVSDFYSRDGDVAHKTMIRNKFMQVGNRSVDFYKFYMIYPICLAILQSYTLTTAQRRKVEQTAKFWANKNKPKSISAAKVIETYLAQVKVLREQYTSLKQIVSTASALDEGAKLKAGSFTLVNTGGFSDKDMANVAALVEKGEALVKAKGFGKLCYGDVHVTRQLSGRGVLAFYSHTHDELFVRTGIRLNVDTVRIFIHELGHRLQHKFLTSKNAEIKALYKKHKSQAKPQEVVPPEIGEEVPYKGETLQVVDVDHLRKRIVFKIKGDESGDKLTLPLASWKSPKSIPVTTGFVTQYAGTEPDENFAELFSFYCIDDLAPAFVTDLESLF